MIVVRSGFARLYRPRSYSASGFTLLVHNPKILNSYGGVANGRLEVERCVALDIVRYMVAVFLGREPLARVNTQPIALDARLALLLILATISNFQALLEIKVSPLFARARIGRETILGTQQWEPIKINSFG
jgi:hypothetical protein